MATPAIINSNGRNKSMARRRYQQGTLLLRGKRVKIWVGRWLEDSQDANGQVTRIRKSVILGTLAEFPTRRLAERELKTRVSVVNSPSYRPSQSITFAQFAERWKTTVLVNHKPASRASEKSTSTG